MESIKRPFELWKVSHAEIKSANCYFKCEYHTDKLLLYLPWPFRRFGFLFEDARQSRARPEMFDGRSSVKYGAFSATHASAVWKQPQRPTSWAIPIIDHHQRGQPGEPGCQSCRGDKQQHILLNVAWHQRKGYTCVVFQKYFILILIQVQGNKRTRIYLTGHGNGTVKVLFCWATLFLDKDMQVNTGGGLQK